jgi:hypothetical protein
MNKVFGIGMSKTGTSTLGRCFEKLNLMPTCGYCQELKELVRAGRSVDPVNLKFEYDTSDPVIDEEVLERVFEFADRFRSFKDSPWYMLFSHLDRQYPRSKFVLTLRESAQIQAMSDWWHNENEGRCSGSPPDEYVERQIRIYEAHNAAVRSYFRDRPDDLLVVSWEGGDGWLELCGFLGLPIPNEPFPHMNAGAYRSPEIFR